MFVHAIDPVLLSLGPLEIRWYGLMYVLAFLVTYYYVRRQVRKGALDLKEKQLDNLLGIMVIGMIIGARLFEAIFYNPSYYLANPLKILFVWEGGLSFHGGLLGIIIAVAYYIRKHNLRKHNLRFFKIADIFVVPLALGSAFGRLGNFINAELYGKITSLPLGVIFPGVEGARHPTQLYEVAYNVIIFFILFSFRNKVKKPGALLGWFMILYAVFRFAVEFIKDMPVYGSLTMGQWLTIPMAIIGLWLVCRNI